MKTQKQMYYEAVRRQTDADLTINDLLYGVNPLTDKELKALIAKRPHVYSRYAGHLGKRPGLEG